ncbi:MAG: hypothetical protein HS115_02305 [Spirochaetales bacterium]|nr:hypothetical protein [Spirochaetales bacterium]
MSGKRPPFLVRWLFYLLGSSALAMGMLFLIVELTGQGGGETGLVFGVGLGMTCLGLGSGLLFLAKQNWQVLLSGSSALLFASMAFVGISKELEDYLLGKSTDLIVGLALIAFSLVLSALTGYAALCNYEKNRERSHEDGKRI